MHVRLPYVMTLTTLLLALAACGGASDSGLWTPPGPDRPVLQGSYHALVFQMDDGSGNFISGSGRYEADAAGNLVGGDMWVSGTGDTDPVVAPSLTYDVDSDRTLTLSPTSGQPLVGRIATNGDLAIATALEDGANPVLVVMMRRRLAPTLSDLEGDWRRCDLNSEAAGLDFTARLSQIGIRAGGAQWRLGSTSIRNGVRDVVLPPPGPVEVTSSYSVDAAGWIRHVNPLGTGADNEIGALSADGNILLMAHLPDASGFASMQIYIRSHLAPDVDEVEGPYAVVGTGFSPPDSIAFGGDFQFPPGGLGSVTLSYNTMGTITPAVYGSVELLPGADDYLLMDLFNGDVHGGLFTPGRGFGVFVGNFQTGGDGQLLLLLR